MKKKHIELKLPKGSVNNSYSVLDTEFTQNGVSLIESMKSTKNYEVKVENFRISGMNDADGRTYTLNRVLKYTERKFTLEDPDPFNGQVVAERSFNLE